jgi:integrase
MAKIFPKFKLKHPKSDKPTLVVLKVYFNTQRFTYSTGETIHSVNWDHKQKDEPYRIIYPRGKESAELRDQLKETDTQLKRYAIEIQRIYRTLETAEKTITPTTLKKEMDKVFKKRPEQQIIDLIGIANLVIKESEKGTRQTKNKTRIKPVTIKGYNTTLNHLKTFKSETGYKLSFDKIDLSFYNKFVRYFQDKNQSTNTIGKNVKNVKVFMKEAFKKGLTTNTIFQDEEFKITEEDTDQIYLNTSELDIIYNLDLSDNKRLDRVRDIFIIGCWTGLRFGDLVQLNETNIIELDGKEFLKIKTIKTGELVIIPLHWTIKEILKKHNGNIPRVISNQKMNEYLKELTRKAEITNMERIVKTRGGLRVDSTSEKCELVTVHTARRSFATNMYMADIPTITIMKITGHRTEKAFLKYIRISPEENALKLAEHIIWKAPLRVAQ